MFRASRLFNAIVVIGICSSAPADAQDAPAQISGAVTDVLDKPLAKAQVIVIADPSHIEREVQSDARGGYLAEGLPPGRYRLQVRAPGLPTTTRELELAPGQDLRLDLQIGALDVSEAITVTENVNPDLDRVPGSVAEVSEIELRQSRSSNLEDVLGFVPGVFAKSRFGADESQFSIRGSGLRNNFHLRGINILINGVPYQDPDGFSDFESLELMATQRVEVWKGANALRFGGNTSGGAINLITETGDTAERLQARVMGGSFGFIKGYASTGDTLGSADYFVSLSGSSSDGYRDHSEQERARVFGNLHWSVSDDTELSFDVIYADVSETLPGSLTREEFDEDPRQADPSNVVQDWGRFFDYVRVGFGVSHQLAAGQDLTVGLYGQFRDMVHPIFQVLDQQAGSVGAEIRYTLETSIAARPNRLVIGFSPQLGETDQKNYQNVMGESGDLAAQFHETAENYGLYLENEFDLAPTFTLVTSARADWAKRGFEDEFLEDGDRSDDRSFSVVSPKLGGIWQPSPSVEVFANASRAYEPPLLLELTSFGGEGFLDLEAQDSWQFELGTRGQSGGRLSWDIAVFDSEIENEIVNENVQPFPGAPFTIPSYRNVARSRRMGLEVGGQGTLASSFLTESDRLSLRIAYTASDFQFVNDVDFGDNDIPGAPGHIINGELRYGHPIGLWIAPALDWSAASYFVDSANTVENDSYAVLGIKAGFEWKSLELLLEMRNLTDTVYSGTVQVDNDNGRFFEPSDGRSVYLGARWQWNPN